MRRWLKHSGSTNAVWLNLFFFFFPRSHFFILRSRYVGTGSHTYYSWVSLREKWMIASFSSCGCDKVPSDVTWLWLLGYQGFCFDSISLLTRSHHLVSHTLKPFWLLCDSTARSYFLPLLDCTLIIFSFCLFLFLPVWFHWLFTCYILIPLAKWPTSVWLHIQFSICEIIFSETTIMIKREESTVLDAFVAYVTASWMSCVIFRLLLCSGEGFNPVPAQGKSGSSQQ